MSDTGNGVNTELDDARRSQKMFLKIDGINNNNGDKEHGEGIIVLSWGFQLYTTDGNGNDVRLAFSPIQFTVQRGEAHTSLLGIRGKKQEKVEFIFRPGGEGSAPLIKLDLSGGTFTKSSGGIFSGTSIEYDTWVFSYNQITGTFAAKDKTPVEINFDNTQGKHI